MDKGYPNKKVSVPEWLADWYEKFTREDDSLSMKFSEFVWTYEDLNEIVEKKPRYYAFKIRT